MGMTTPALSAIPGQTSKPPAIPAQRSANGVPSDNAAPAGQGSPAIPAQPGGSSASGGEMNGRQMADDIISNAHNLATGQTDGAAVTSETGADGSRAHANGDGDSAKFNKPAGSSGSHKATSGDMSLDAAMDLGATDPQTTGDQLPSDSGAESSSANGQKKPGFLARLLGKFRKQQPDNA